MNKMAAIILQMSEIMKDMPHSSYLSVKELLASSSWKYLHDCPDRKYTQEPIKIVMEGDQDFIVAGTAYSPGFWLNFPPKYLTLHSKTKQ